MTFLTMFFKDRTCKPGLRAGLNIAFGLVLSVPMITATLFSVSCYSRKTDQEAAAKIGSDMKIAEMMFRESVSEMEMTALGYARKKEVPVSFGLREKLGGALEKDAEKDNLDLVSIIDRSSDCIVRSCRPQHTETAMSGLSSAGIMIMTKAEAETEGPEIPSERIPVMIGMAPVRDRNMEKIIAALAVRRFFRTDTLKKIGKALNTEAALLYGN